MDKYFIVNQLLQAWLSLDRNTSKADHHRIMKHAETQASKMAEGLILTGSFKVVHVFNCHEEFWTRSVLNKETGWLFEQSSRLNLLSVRSSRPVVDPCSCERNKTFFHSTTIYGHSLPRFQLKRWRGTKIFLLFTFPNYLWCCCCCCCYGLPFINDLQIKKHDSVCICFPQLSMYLQYSVLYVVYVQVSWVILSLIC